MRRSTLILAAAALDWLVGDPEFLPHPTRLMGAGITLGESLLHPGSCGSERLQFFAGCTLTTCIATAAFVLPLAIQRHFPQSAKPLLSVLLASTTLAARNLDDEARAVLEALECHDLPQARARLGRIVGRDTGSLAEAAVCRALIETLAESLSDGVIAPLFFLTLGGVPAAMAFKAVSTMDSMIGHRTPRYLYFGRAAARLDDAANYLPARLTAAGLLALAPGAYPVYQRDCGKHASPNAGHPEAAMAALLGVQLGGPSSYGGEPHDAPLLNAGRPLPTPADARRALVLTRGVAIVAVCAAAALARLAERRRL